MTANEYLRALTAAHEAHKPINAKIIAAALDNQEGATAAAREAVKAYRAALAKVITAAADYRAAAITGEPETIKTTAAALTTAAKDYCFFFAANKADGLAIAFNVKEGEKTAAAAARIATAILPAAINGTARDVDGVRVGRVNLLNDTAATAAASEALETYVYNRINNVAVMDSAAFMADKAARKAAAKAKKEAAKAAKEAKTAAPVKEAAAA